MTLVMVYQAVYGSTETHPFSPAELVRLLQTARANNARRGVTGMLLYHDHSFMQILEGDREAVAALVARIAADTRHRGFTMFHQGEVAEREFGEWSMAFRAPSLDDWAALEGFREIGTLSPELFPPGKARAFLKSFRALTRIDQA
ncbi:MAG: BLUF domain-containing protein [Bryobacterales bacterium]|nr:BLUF domain-containing protein [Bryobacterales bacterium]